MMEYKCPCCGAEFDDIVEKEQPYPGYRYKIIVYACPVCDHEEGIHMPFLLGEDDE